MKRPSLWDMLKETFRSWQEDNASRLAAATAYYTLFSIAPLLVIAIAIAGFFFGQKAAQGQIVSQIGWLVGSSAAGAIQDMIRNAHQTGSGTIATIVGVIVLLVGASGAFGALQGSLNTIWEVKQDPKNGIRATIVNRIFSFAMVLVIGFLLLVSLVISAALTALGTFFQNLLPGAGSSTLFQVIDVVVSFGVITLLFALIYKVLPDVDIPWRDVWIGAIFTALLFTIGKQLIGLYLGRPSVTSVYGAAGSLVILLLWVYYSAIILYFGAEFTQVYARARGEVLHPTRGAVWMTTQDLAHQGITRSTPRQTAQASQQSASERAAGAAGLVPAMAVAGAGRGDRDLQSMTRPELPEEAGRPPMPEPVRLLTAVAGALVAAVGASLLMFTRSRPKRANQELIKEGRKMQDQASHLLQEAGRLRIQAMQMSSRTNRLDSLGEDLRRQGAKINKSGQKMRDRGLKGG